MIKTLEEEGITPVKHYDSIGHPIYIGDRVLFRGKGYTIKRFVSDPEGDPENWIEFHEEQHTPEVALEWTVDKIGGDAA